MNRSPERLVAIGVGSGLLLLIVSVGVAFGMISTIGGAAASGATVRSLLLVVVGGGGLAIIVIAASAYPLVRPALTAAPSHPDSPDIPRAAVSTPNAAGTADTTMSRS